MINIDIIIPTLNEGKHFRNCIDSVLAFDLPDDCEIKIFIVDGGSVDNTIDLINEFIKKYANIYFLRNPNKIQPSALNIALKSSSGQYIMRLDAHSLYPKNYLKKCYETIKDTNADNVGGIFVPIIEKSSFFATIVLALTTHRFGVGNGDFRISNQSKYVDTVPYGFFNRQIFEKIGLFDVENFPHYYADDDFTLRATKAGFKFYCSWDAELITFPNASGASDIKNSKGINGLFLHLTSIKGAGRLKDFIRYSIRHSPKYLIPFVLLNGTLRRIINFYRK
jgi:glycosyltransferase involved in cell wall biosynthesis